jgi:hypothetical protein
MSDEQTVAVRAVRKVMNPDKAPDTVHHVLFARVGTDILLEAGYFNLLELKEAMDAARGTGEVQDVTLTIHHSLHLSPRVLRQLVGAASEILAGLSTEEE